MAFHEKKRGFGGKSGGKSFEKHSTDLHSATCAECGVSCQVPFKPNGKKPVFCKNCFKPENTERGERSGGFERRGGGFAEKRTEQR